MKINKVRISFLFGLERGKPLRITQGFQRFRINFSKQISNNYTLCPRYRDIVNRTFVIGTKFCPR